MNTPGGSMTKAELVEEVSRVSDLTKKHSEVIVDTVFKSIIDALHRGEKIELRGFGSFRLRKREPRKGRNPKTGDKVDVPPKKVPVLQARQGAEGPDQPRGRGRRGRGGADRSGRAARGLLVLIRRSRSARMDRLWSPWRLDYVTGSKADVGCVFCTEPNAAGIRFADRPQRRAVLRHPQSLSLQPRPPDGAAVPARAGAGRPVGRRAARARGPDAAGGGGAGRAPTGRRASTSASTWACRPAPASASICTCTWCRAGTATPTS